MKKLGGYLALAVGVCLVGWLAFQPVDDEGGGRSAVVVEKGVIVRQALAMGHVTVEHEVPVKSTMGGILSELYVDLGEEVKAGTPLAEVRPVITSRDFVEAERSLELAKDQQENAEEFVSGSHLAAVLTRMVNGAKNIERMQRQAELNVKQVEEQIELLNQGKTTAEGRAIDFNVLAPVDGHVIEIVTRQGAPVVSSSSFGSGSVLVVLADLDRLLFIGTVDEIDVGRLKVGMQATIQVGALPDVSVKGTVTEIGLKSTVVNNASVFDVRIALELEREVSLRSGYSAVAQIELDRRDEVLVIPERLVRFSGADPMVSVLSPSGETEERRVELGLSDGLMVEVVSGLSEGERLRERN